MSLISISDLQYLSPSSLASSLPSSSIAIIDVRGSDFLGGHIRNCIHCPTSTHDTAIPELVRTLSGKEMVVFHCALSQQRGPAAALRYLRERERLLGKGAGEQKVVVLEGGFAKWQEQYGENSELTEDYRKDIWEFGY